jgi:hypothetical protein
MFSSTECSIYLCLHVLMLGARLDHSLRQREQTCNVSERNNLLLCTLRAGGVTPLAIANFPASEIEQNTSELLREAPAVVASSNIILAKWVCLREKLILYKGEAGSDGELLCAVLATFCGFGDGDNAELREEKEKCVCAKKSTSFLIK